MQEEPVGATNPPSTGSHAHRLAGHTAVVTGASRGIGRATALLLARAGARVALVARSGERLEEAAHEARGAGGEAIALPADLADAGQCTDVIRRASQHFGSVDILVNNAGRLGGGLLAEVDPEAWIRTIQVDLLSPFLLARAALPAMIERRRGKVVFVTSAVTTPGIVLPGLSAYTVAKSGLNQLTTYLTAEVARHGIQVNAVDPGPVDTTMAGETLALPYLELWAPEMVTFIKEARLAPPSLPARLILWVLNQTALSGQVLSVTDPAVRQRAGLD